MTQEISLVRSKLSKAPILVKQNNLISAAHAARKGVGILLSKSLMRAEQEEFVTLVEAACHAFSLSQEVKALFPLSFAYEPGKEEELAATLDEFIAALDSDSASQAQSMAAMMEAEKQAELAKGQLALDEKRYDDARQIFSALYEGFSSDAELASDIAERFMAVSLYNDAVQYFQQSIRVYPDSSATLNQLGIALRKIQRFDLAEKTFLKALALAGSDPNLHFNLGRLYLDQKRWDKALACAEKALELVPDFAEAGKMAAYCRKQAAGTA